MDGTKQRGHRRGGKKIYDRDALYQLADPLAVAQAIGMDIQMNHGSRISVLCPGHDDRQHGSCFLTAHGCRCYVCGQDYNVFEMVMLHEQLSFREAAGIVADTCGGREHFLKDRSADVTAGGILNSADLLLLGLCSRPIYALEEIEFFYRTEQPEPGYRHELVSCNEDTLLYTAVLRCVEKNPLAALRNAHAAEYEELVRTKSLEALAVARAGYRRAQTRSFSEAREFQSDIRRLEEILIEHGGHLADEDAEGDIDDECLPLGRIGLEEAV